MAPSETTPPAADVSAHEDIPEEMFMFMLPAAMLIFLAVGAAIAIFSP